MLANAAQKMEHIVPNRSVHTALQATSKDLPANLRANLLSVLCELGLWGAGPVHMMTTTMTMTVR